MGRTGVGLAMALVMLERMTASDAVKHVRAKRRGSVQTFKQEDGVAAFAAFWLQRQAERTSSNNND